MLICRVCDVSLPFSDSALALTVSDLGIQIFPDYSPSFPQLLPRFAEKNCNDPFEKLQSFLAQGSKHARVCKSSGIHTHNRISLLILPVFSISVFPTTHTHTHIVSNSGGDEPPEWSKAHSHLPYRHWSGPPIQHSAGFHFLFCTKSQASHRKAPTTFGMCCSPSILLCHRQEVCLIGRLSDTGVTSSEMLPRGFHSHPGVRERLTYSFNFVE